MIRLYMYMDLRMGFFFGGGGVNKKEYYEIMCIFIENYKL